MFSVGGRQAREPRQCGKFCGGQRKRAAEHREGFATHCGHCGRRRRQAPTAWHLRGPGGELSQEERGLAGRVTEGKKDAEGPDDGTRGQRQLQKAPHALLGRQALENSLHSSGRFLRGQVGPR